MAAHVFAAAGLIGLSLFPEIFPSAYSGLSAAVMIYAAGGGMIEVIISPIVDSLPGDEKASAMSLLHSFYCWGQMAVVLISTLFRWIAGEGLWKLLPVAWCIVPAFNTFRFARVPLMPPVPEEKLMQVAAQVGPVSEITAITARSGNLLEFTLKDGTKAVKRWQDRSRAESWTEEMRRVAGEKTRERKKDHAKS